MCFIYFSFHFYGHLKPWHKPDWCTLSYSLSDSLSDPDPELDSEPLPDPELLPDSEPLPEPVPLPDSDPSSTAWAFCFGSFDDGGAGTDGFLDGGAGTLGLALSGASASSPQLKSSALSSPLLPSLLSLSLPPC